MSHLLFLFVWWKFEIIKTTGCGRGLARERSSQSRLARQSLSANDALCQRGHATYETQLGLNYMQSHGQPATSAHVALTGFLGLQVGVCSIKSSRYFNETPSLRVEK